MQIETAYIATSAFLEHFIVEEALAKESSLQESSKNVCYRFGLGSDQQLPSRQTRLLGLLYCLLVFPSEKWRQKSLMDVVIERANIDADLLEENAKYLNAKSLRSFRNATAHARIEFTTALVTFVDKRGNSSPHFSESLTYQQITNLLLVLGRAFHEAQQVLDATIPKGRNQ